MNTNSVTKGDFTIADWRVCPRLNEVRRSGFRANLEPKAIAVLTYLARRSGEVCSRKEILDSVWEGTSVTEEVLTQAIYQIRRAVNDSAQNPKFVQTIPRQGYRLVAPVSWLDEPPRRRQEDRKLGTPIFRLDTVRRHWWLVVAMVAFAGTGWLWLGASSSEPGAETGSLAARRYPIKIAVLPFQVLGEATDELLMIGLREEIIGRLAGVRELGVIARTSTQAYDSNVVSLRQLREELGVAVALTGSVRWVTSTEGAVRARVTARLTSTLDGTVLWASNYELGFENLIAVQIEVTSEVLRELNMSLDAMERRTLASRATEDPAAYQAFLRGLQHARNPDVSAESLDRARRIFERALELDPDFARAWAELSIVLSYSHWLGFGADPGRLERAQVAAQRALTLDPDLAHAHLAMGYFHYYGHRRYDKALESFRRAEKGLPGDAEAVGASAWVLRRMGRFKEAALQLEKSFDLDPRMPWLARELGVTYRMLRRYEEAATVFRRALELAPDASLAASDLALNHLLWSGDTAQARRVLADANEHPAVLWERCWIEMLDRDYEAAIQVAADFDSFFGSGSWPRALVEGWAYAELGHPGASRQAFQRVRLALENSVTDSPGFALDGLVRRLASDRSNLAWAYAALGENGDAISQAKLSVAEQPIEEDALWGTDRLLYLAHVLAITGDENAAIEILGDLLTRPADFSTALLVIDPRWDSLRDHPRYEALVRGERPAGPPGT